MNGNGKQALLLGALLLLALQLLPRLIGGDLFLDGLTYASLARNQAEGRGSFWRPHYSQTVYPEFFEQPPLGIWLQSLAFRLFGDSPLVESLWGAGCGALILLLMGLIWRAAGPPGSGSWWPILLFALSPLVAWTLANNLLEGTMAGFTCLAGWAAIRAVGAPGPAGETLFSLLAGLGLTLGMMTKGFPGAFPLVVPLAACWSGGRGAGRGIRDTALMLLAAGAGLGLFFWSGGGEALAWMRNYLYQQVGRSLMGMRESSSSHLFLLGKLAGELALPLVFLFLVHRLAVRRRLPEGASPPGRNSARLFFFVAFSSFLPLLISPKQQGWYLFPGLPWWALALAAAFPDGGRRIEEALAKSRRWRTRLALGFLLGILATGVLSFWFRGALTSRRPDIHRDLAGLSVTRLAGRCITVSPAGLMSDWYLVAFMQRRYRASLTDQPGEGYRLLDLSTGESPAPACRTLNPRPPRRYWIGSCPAPSERRKTEGP